MFGFDFIDPQIQMWAVFGIIIFSLISYSMEKIPLELTSLMIIVILLIFFYIFPVVSPETKVNLLDPAKIFQGFANPALIAVLSLLVVGQALVHTGALDKIADFVIHVGGSRGYISIAVILICVIGFSGFLNNTPVVVIFIPILQAIAKKYNMSTSRVMIPLSYAAILGGSITLIGSSTNLLVSSKLVELGQSPLHFFEFTTPGLVLAGIGFLFIFMIVPFILPDRAGLMANIVGSNKQFVAQITVSDESKLVGQTAISGMFPDLKDITLLMIQRDEHAEVAPFDDITIRRNDILVVAATRETLTELLKSDPGLKASEQIEAEEEEDGKVKEQILAEVMISPSSRMAGLNLEQVGFRYHFNCLVLGIQRRSRMIRERITEMRLQVGDVLLIQGQYEDIEAVKLSQDLILLESSKTNLPTRHHSRRAAAIFLSMVAVSALGIFPIVIASITAAGLMLLSGCINLRQAARSIDQRIIMMIAASLALSTSLQETGGATFIAQQFVYFLDETSPTFLLSALFLIVALTTNILSNNACAVLFTPIAIEMAISLEVDVIPFAITVLLASNCSFASPLGYHTNLLVMGPGHYRFADYFRSGIPLTLIIWIAFTLFFPWYYGFK